MIIQSKKVWIADQFTPAQLELEDGIIKEIYPYDEKEVTKDYGDLKILPALLIFIAMELMVLIQMMLILKD